MSTPWTILCLKCECEKVMPILEWNTRSTAPNNCNDNQLQDLRHWKVYLLGPLVPWINHLLKNLDELMTRWHLKAPQSLSGRALHLTLVTKWSWSWSWMTYSHPICSMWIGPPILRNSYFKSQIWPWKFKGQGHCQGQTHWSHLRRWSSMDMFVFRQSNNFWLRYSKFHIFPWKFKVKGHGQGQSWWSHLRPWVQLMCLLLVLWQWDHFWLRYSKLFLTLWTLKIQGQGHNQGQIWWSHLRPRVQSICLLFVLQQ